MFVDLLDALINNVLETGYDKLPADAIEASRKQFLDILAATIGGSTCSISGDLEGLVGCHGGLSLWNGDAELGEAKLGLVFVKFHRVSLTFLDFQRGR